MLDGQGADELLYGYFGFRRAFVGGLIRAGKWRTGWSEAKAFRGPNPKAISMLWRGAVDAATPVLLQKQFRQARRNRRSPSWFRADRLQATFPGRLASRFQSHTTAAELSLELMTGGHLQMLLHWEDRNSMAHSVESRLPFLDYRLVEFAFGLPDQFKIRAGRTKAVLRAGLRGIVPQNILDRTDKMGFVTPEEIWARENAPKRFRSALHESIEASGGILTDAGKEQFERVLAGEQAYDWSIWRMICFGRWVKRFGVSL
jgi:asparagine synthase (glutamine-hydrolysing)